MKSMHYMKVIILLILIATVPFQGSSQTLFTYGKYAVDAKEFLRAFNKNNNQADKDRPKAIREYLDLYINSRLKIREAYDRRYDTLPQVATEVQNLRNQISQNYINDPTVSAKLQREAFQRSQKDIQVAHIFISFKNQQGIVDTVAAGKKLEELLDKLKKGEDFSKLAKTYSDDTTARVTGGELGWITVFILPYTIENVVYALAPGKFSQPIRSKTGYYIIKNLRERKAAGKMKAQQILIALPPDATESDKNKASALADSLYKQLQKGSRFETLATQFSNDYISAATGGNIPDIGVGQYDPLFEKMAWGLNKDSAITKPFLTSHGWHIVKRLGIKPIVSDSSDANNLQELLNQVMADSRWKVSKEFISKKVGLTSLHFRDEDLYKFTDSVLAVNRETVNGRITSTTPLLKLAGTTVTAEDWVRYAKPRRRNEDGSMKSYDEIKTDWMQEIAFDHYQAHLDDYNEDFRNQMNEFKDGNLFFEIMQQEVWNKAQNDTAALQALFEKDKRKYDWQKSADAVIFFCSDEASARTLQAAIKKTPNDWKKILDQYADKAVADSSRFEWTQLPIAPGTVPVAGQVTNPQVNENDNSASFAYIIRVFHDPLPRNFNEAKGIVINDYQDKLEKEWIVRLKKKYPVVVNQKVLESISR